MRASVKRGPGSSELWAGFEAFYAVRYPDIAAYVRRRVPVDEADDVVSQVFTVAWRRFGQVPAPPADRLWLFGVARHSLAEHWRSERRRNRLRDRLSDVAQTSGGYRAEPGSLQEAVQAAVSALPASGREALRLVLWEDLSHAEAAEVIGCSVNAFELRYRRARAAVRAALSGLQVVR